MENKTLKYITTVCLTILAVWNIFDFFNYFNLGSFIAAIGSVLVVVALLTKTPVLSTVGFVLMALQTLIACVTNFEAIIGGWIPLTLVLLWVLYIVVCVLLMLTSIVPKSAKNLGVIATIIAMIRLVITIIRNIVEGYGITATTIVWGMLFAASAMLIGINYDNMTKNALVSKDVTPIKVATVEQGILEGENVEKRYRFTLR